MGRIYVHAKDGDGTKRERIHSPDILHIATHGFFSIDKVKLNTKAKKDFLFYSGLVFAGANKNINEEKREIAMTEYSLPLRS